MRKYIALAVSALMGVSLMVGLAGPAQASTYVDSVKFTQNADGTSTLAIFEYDSNTTPSYRSAHGIPANRVQVVTKAYTSDVAFDTIYSKSFVVQSGQVAWVHITYWRATGGYFSYYYLFTAP